ncbi:MAG: GNAT family N-acetyltransferase, partial [Rickettsiales bacterium]|nr:GNAT family N-acetyltransferase [Rickettsiales bacterium]
MEENLIFLSEELVGERIQLCRSFPYDYFAADLFKGIMASKVSLGKWLPWTATVKSWLDTKLFLAQSYQRWEEGVAFHYFVCPKGTDDVMGTIEVINFDQKNLVAELGYLLFDEFVGKGYMQEAVKILEKELFAKGVNRIEIQVDTFNSRSVNIAVKLGYEFEGVLRENRLENGQFQDTNMFSKL